MEFWKYDLADTVYNCTFNNALDHNGRVIFIDLGEFSGSKEKALQDIRAKKWLGQASYVHLKDLELKAFFGAEIERQLTEEKLQISWGTLAQK